MKTFVIFACFLIVVFNFGIVEAVRCYDCKQSCASPKPYCNGNYCYYVGAVAGSGNNTVIQGCNDHKYIDWIPGNFSMNECHRADIGGIYFNVKVCDKDLCNEPCSASTMFSIIPIILVFGFYYSLIH